MTFLPIVERELRAVARRRGTYWTRLALALLGTGVGVVVFALTVGLLSPQQTGQFIFRGLSGMLLLYCFAYGRRATADCLSVEKREGTLGLLFLTDLKGHDVVLGKLFATSIGGFYGLLAVVPVLSVSVLLGGVTSGEFWRMVLVLVDTFLLSLSIGMLGSSLSRSFRQAMASNFLLMLAVVAVLPAFAGTVAFFSASHALVPELLFCCPLYPFFLAFDATYKTGSVQFWSSVGVIHVLAWVLVLLASRFVPRSWQDQTARAATNRWAQLWQNWSFGDKTKRSSYRKQALDVNAFYWLAARARLKPLHVWTFLGFIAVWWATGWLTSGRLWFDESEFLLTALMLNFTLKVWVVIEAGQELADDQKSGAVELLLSVPLTVQEILHGQILALRRQFLKPLLAVLGLELVFLWVLRHRQPDTQSLVTWLAGIFMLVADISALVWVAMLRALLSRSHNQATIGTLARVLVLPWALFGVVLGAGNVWSAFNPASVWSPGWEFYLGLWFGFGVAADLAFGLHAWWRLRTHFRELALGRFNPRPSRFSLWAERLHAAAKARANRRTAPAPAELPTRRRGRRRALLTAFLLLVGVITWLSLRQEHRFPPPQLIQLGRNAQKLQIFPVNGGAYFILPDGSLWRWGQTGGLQLPRAAVPEQVGTNRNWVQVSGAGGHCVGLQEDGSIWEWGSRGPNISVGPVLVDSHHSWKSVSASFGHAAALRSDGTLWMWGQNSFAQIGPPVQQAQTNLVQVGNSDGWVAVKCHWACTLALRSDGTLWVWGQEYFAGTAAGRRATAMRIPVPTRLCGETNWTRFSVGIAPLVVNRAGELWDPFFAPANPQAPASASCRPVNGTDGHTAIAFTGSERLFQIRSDGTLWKSDYSPLPGASPPLKWARVGKRSDWIELWSGSGTAFGRTRDGMVWTWGIDAGREPVADFATRLNAARIRLRAWTRPTAGMSSSWATSTFQSEPRPLIQIAPPSR